ncbi:ATP-grasp peptide maturase system methyltransferase [Nonomuraea cavernae]|uniref:ATP-grasp peptide maturase system methyltransferase n=1 Tax=Nonomuraea cavernae TaxID=2045107 RepID=UPI00340DA533
MTDRRAGLAERLVSGGHLHNPQWRAAVEHVSREIFLGDAIFRRLNGPNGTRWEPVRRHEVGDEEWLRMADSDESWVTQVDGVMAEAATETMGGSPTCSSTLPSLVVRMLEVAGVGDTDSVLEIGTGTGYSTALLCHRLGEVRVTSVEYDRAVAAGARAALARQGYSPTLVVGDGLGGHPENAEYDHLIATCSVRYIPAPWLWQVRDGGTITAPLTGWMYGSAFAHLRLGDDGTASGRFRADDLSFMPARPHQPPPRSPFYLTGLGEERASRIDPNLLDDSTGVFVAQLAAPSAEKIGGEDEVFLVDVATGSQATTKPAPDGGWSVRQHGPLRLWDAVEDAILTWQRAGSPHQSAFGLTVTRDGRQRVWLGEPDGPSWNLPV